jgi:hypothetical protein
MSNAERKKLKILLDHWIEHTGLNIIESTAWNLGNGQRRQKDSNSLKLVKTSWKPLKSWIKQTNPYYEP